MTKIGGALAGEPADLVRQRLQHVRRRIVHQARLRHPYLVAARDVVEDRSGLWLVTEHVPGAVTLAQAFSAHPLQTRETARIGAAVLDALESLHANGMVHGDVRPGAILLAPDESGDPHGRVLLANYRPDRALVDHQLVEQTLDRADFAAVMGSPAYMAPEMIRGFRATEASDAFSLGATLYAAVVGHSPFARPPGEDWLRAVSYAVVHEDALMPPEVGPLEPVLRGLLAKQPEERVDLLVAALKLREIAEGSHPMDVATTGLGLPALPVARGPQNEPPVPKRARGAVDTGRPPAPSSWVLPALLLVAFCAGLALGVPLGSWWSLALFGVVWAGLVAVGSARALCRPSGPATVQHLSAGRSRAAAFLDGFTAPAGFLRSSPVASSTSPGVEVLLRDAYEQLGPPPAEDPGTAGGGR
ncbi:serine/threonine-protein kinase [Streptomyces fuscigenes]|uniref:serine/threonine-protein kinase n=1 Tax=Streptomyces fuscigenes TaxID=1528880 RepID=UPI001F27975D|nr:serine/threonine-protein kinase [Streptomyces fuscigenes]MCF3960094.1 serine/threonine protein kinase [Streptomyces fuscigenes]